MTKQEIDGIKKSGLRAHLLAASSSKLWDAKRHLEKAEAESFSNFKASVDAARECITDAERLWAETYSI